MIPATSILIDGDTALYVLTEDVLRTGNMDLLNRPCDTCDGKGRVRHQHGGLWPDCSDCDGTGRHTFTVEVDYGSGNTYGGRTRGEPWGVEFRVHVIDVLPIRSGRPPAPEWPAGERMVHMMDDAAFIITARGGGYGAIDCEQTITLPPDAAPGKWLVRLKVHHA